MTEPLAQTPKPAQRRSWSDLRPRLLSALVLIAVTVAALWAGGWALAGLVGLVFAGAYREWEQMVCRVPLQPFGMVLVGLLLVCALLYPLAGVSYSAAAIVLAMGLAFAFGGQQAAWRAAGLGFFGAVIIALLAVRGTGPAGIYVSLFMGTVVWMTDSAAFFTGRQVGGEKLAPGISPSKTWSGALGGLALGTVAGTLVWLMVTSAPWWIGAIFALIISVLGQLGDLSESAIKRHFRVKDSGDIIPGHGGLMDRLDSLTFSALFVCLLGTLHAGFGAVAQGFLHW